MTIPPKSKRIEENAKNEPEPELELPETKTDVLNPPVNPAVDGKIDLSKDAWEIFNIDNLPTLSDEQVKKYEKHVADRRQVWIKSKMKDTVFPIRCRVLVKDPKNGEEPEFKMGKDDNPEIVIKNFKYNPISLYQREKIVMMSSEVVDLQRIAQALAIIKSIEATPNLTDIKIDFEGLPTILKNEDFGVIQQKLMKKQMELNKYRFKAYFNMSDRDVLIAYWGDTRDWLDVCIEKEQHVLDPQIGIM